MEGSIYLTDLEKNVVNRIHAHILEGEKVSIDVIAKECFVSKALVVKLAKKLGYSGYSEMYYVLMSSNRNQKSADFSHMVHQNETNTAREGITLLTDLLNEYRGAKIHLDSIGLCDAARDYYLQKLLMFGFDAVSSYHFAAFHKDSAGLFIFMSFSGSRFEIFDRVHAAADNGFKVLALTARKDSPLGTMADYTIEISGERTEENYYRPDFFTANLIILLEMALCEYSQKYINQENRTK
ncbi:MurR/RpiR family transcriptional regulator [Clostridium sp. Marseille-P2415]|uniref:MurR/RpiR family transcriptional regulator n=1 Tax=Clostridium sp. Marseille-P2415 TaxID=1805471 RepID=UPI0009888C1F|nr:MurR/RpiR family transcriptional regulator [Clostridium sp. Marseille-P2415]